MKKLIAIAFIALSLTVSAQVNLEQFAPDNIFGETYLIGANDTPSIGILRYLLIDSTAKTKYAKVNPEIVSLKVTGTAAPFDKRVPFSKWLDDYVTIDSSDLSVKRYSISYRYDGVVQEFLTVYQQGEWKRTVIISRIQGSIITVWDSMLN